MKAYISSAITISPQKTFKNPLFLDEVEVYTDNRLTCIEPDYSEAIDPRLIRRMSRIIKMSVASALACLKEAAVAIPDAIVTGTAYGCLEDTSVFLSNMIEYSEEPITPTAFVQSTHNTIGAQVALLIKCRQYNNTFVSGGASFENALLDAMMLLAENDNSNVLVGGMDEITDMSHIVLSRMGLYKRKPASNLDLFKTASKGTINGEGAAFFLLANKPSSRDLACVDAVTTFYKPTDITETANYIKTFLTTRAINCSDIDLLITGNNGDTKNDEIYAQIQTSVLADIPSVNYKHLCGEYPTSTAFAVWLGSNIIKNNAIPDALNFKPISKSKINKVLIYNHYQNTYHSLILLSSC
ncbi:beta-ketoacyl synthase chain length factor [Mucilaginibacter sp. dw_454]|uniref:beta-ketoacyl synthase chain length factor n=1 Tax=Mucilaginibacter sp. dw_454 TaxID=2720079 RepID=UPI001BD50FDA|nr:beta-ketoacyl synthase chain length factor [Mucilaginibacter sp. dw_454]